jgi:hypothetical protein
MALFYKKNSFAIKGKEELKKSVIQPVEGMEYFDGKINRNKAVFSLKSERSYDGNLVTKGRRLTDKDLLLFSQSDSIVSLIISTRANQCSSYGIRARNKYESGTLIRDVEPSRSQINKSREEIEQDLANKDALVKLMYQWILNCGTTNEKTKNAIFQGSDDYFKHCSLSEFFGSQGRNLLITGRMATQIIRNTQGRILMFRPLPIESIFIYKTGMPLSITENDPEVPEQVKIDVEKYNSIPFNQRPQAWVQKINEKVVSFFTERDLRIDYLQKQAHTDLNGYPLAPLEMAINALQLHMNAQQYMNNSLTKGLASKGFITLTPRDSTDSSDMPSPEELDIYRKELQNYIAGSYNNSAVIPIFAGNIDVEFKTFNATTKDMEFLNLYNYVIAILCASFQIAPEEIGFNGTGTKTSLGDQGSQSQIVQGQERGLRQLMNLLSRVVTEIAWDVFPDAKDVLILETVGLGQNTKEKDLQIYKEQLQTDGTMGRIWAHSEHPEAFPFCQDMPTSPVFHTHIRPLMLYSELRYYFMGDKTALKNPAYDFICDASMNQAYMQNKTLANQPVTIQNQQTGDEQLEEEPSSEISPNETKAFLNSIPSSQSSNEKDFLDKAEMYDFINNAHKKSSKPDNKKETEDLLNRFDINEMKNFLERIASKKAVDNEASSGDK